MAKRIHYRATFAVLGTAALSVSLLQSLIIPALPALERTLHTSASGASWLLTGSLLCSAIATPILGRVGDIVGKEKMLVTVLVVTSAGTLISALATTFPVMLAGRVVQGAGGAIFPLSFGIIRDEFPRQKVAWGIGTMAAMLGVGSGFGVVLAGPIIEHLSYHWLFWIPGALSLAATTAAFIFVPASPVRAPGRVNWTGASLMTGWLVTGLLAVSYGPAWGWRSASVLGLLGVTVVLIAGWIRSESGSDSPMVDMKMMRIRVVWSTNLVALLFGVGMFSMFIIVPGFAETPARVGYGFGASVTQSGLYLLPFAVAMLLVAPLTGRLSEAVGSKPVLIVGAVFAAASYGLLAVAHTQPGDLYVATGLLGVGTAFGYASMSNLIVEAVPASQTGVATGMNSNIRIIGAAVGSAVTTSLIVSGVMVAGHPKEHGYVLAFAACGAALVVAAIAAFRVPGGRALVALSQSPPGPTAEPAVMAGAMAYLPEE